MLSFLARKVLESTHDEEEKEILIFGLERLRVALISIIAIVITGLMLGEFIETIFFVICLLPLRQNAGGYHMKNKRICAVCSYVIFLLSLLVIKHITIGRVAALLITILSVIVVCITAPVSNFNNVLDEMEVRVYGTRTRIICLIELILFFVFFIINNPKWYTIIMLSELIVGILLVGQLIQEKVLKLKGIDKCIK